MSRLKNRGPVALSPTNPYIAANLLLAKEMEQSPELKGFIEHSGQPSAIQIDEGMLASPTIRLFYSEKKQYFNLEDLDGSWLINGPFNIETNELAAAEPAPSQPALLIPPPSETPAIQEQPLVPFTSLATVEPTPEAPMPTPIHREKAARTSSPKPTKTPKTPLPTPSPIVTTPEPTPIPTPQSTPLSKVAPAFTSPAADDAEESATPKPSTVLGDLVEPMHPGEITSHGDLVHHVTFPGETLSIIARWYTADRNNAGKIARINKIANPDQLSVGDTVIVPSYLLRNKNRLTQNGMNELGAKAAQETKKGK